MPATAAPPVSPVRYPCQIVVRVSRETYDAIAAMPDRSTFLRKSIDRAAAKARKTKKGAAKP